MGRGFAKQVRTSEKREFDVSLRGAENAKLFNEIRMVRLDGEVSNQVIEILADWNTYLEQHRRDFDPPVLPCP